MRKQSILLLPKISKLFHITCLDKILGNLDKLCFRRFGGFNDWPSTCKDGEKKHFQEDQCVAAIENKLTRVEENEQANELERYSVIMQLGFEDRPNWSYVKPAETTSNQSLGKVVAEDMAVERVKEEEVNERKMRIETCSEVLGRLKEIEVMESSDLNQLLDLNEVVICYSMIRNGFFVDLVNQFITDVSDGIYKRTM